MIPAGDPLGGRDLYRQLLPSVAWVQAGREGRGTGWVVDLGKKRLVTNYHTVGDAKAIEVMFPQSRDGRLVVDREAYQVNIRKWKIDGRVVRRSPERDLALIELTLLPEGAKAIPLAEVAAGPGEAVRLIGNRGDLDQMWGHAAGFVRQTYHSADGYPWRTMRLGNGSRLLALQLPINEGDSGGPVVNHRGELVGVASAILWQAQRSAAAIDVSEVRAFLYPDTKPSAKPQAAKSVYSQLVRAAVWVQSPSATTRATGWLFDRDRKLIISSAQAVGPHERVEVVFPLFEKGRLVSESARYADVSRVRAGVIARDVRRNLAVVEVEALPTDSTALGLSEQPAQPGDSLHAVGNPTGLDALWAYAAFTVRQTGTITLSSHKDDGSARVLILQGPAGGSDSGGPIVNESGQVVAVAGGKDGEQQVSYAVDLSELRAFLDETHAKWKPTSAQELHQRGRRRMRVRWLDAALADFRAALRAEPNYEPVYVDLADLLRLRGETKEALAIVQHALKLLPPGRCAVPASLRAQLIADLGKSDEALAVANEAVKLDPKCARAFAARAEVWRRQKELAKALADADEAIWLDANLATAYFQRGIIQADRKEWDRAVADLGRAAELEPFDPTPLLKRAEVYDRLLEPDKAKADRAAAQKLAQRR
jgi:S1-C subfamily serine protease/Flp pilus assembly protein TadD